MEQFRSTWFDKLDKWLILLAWATPFKIHTPPVEDFEKSVSQGEHKVSNAPTFCVIFRLGLSQME